MDAAQCPGQPIACRALHSRLAAATSQAMTDTPRPPMRAAIIPVTPLQQNCSLIWCTKTMRGALVDPGGDLDRLKAGVAKAGVTLEKLLVTHGHLDHCGQTGVDRDAVAPAIQRRDRLDDRRRPVDVRAHPIDHRQVAGEAV